MKRYKHQVWQRFYLNDGAKVFGKVGFISCFCKGGVDAKNIEGNYITKGEKIYKQATYKDLEFIDHNNC